MKKLCLILTVLYAFGANCSAQSSLNIAENLLKGNSSTFNSGWGDWGDQGDHCGRILEPAKGLDGSQCARLTPIVNATQDYNAQLRYNFTATKGTTYVFRLKAKKVSGNGTIKAIMQHNTGDYDQKIFFEKNVTGDWATYEGEVTVTRNDYDVIMINYGYCGDVLIDDIEFGVKTNNVDPVQATGVTLDKTLASVKQGKTLTLTATVAPADATNKNVTWSSDNESVATVSDGVVTGVATGTAQITATTVDGNHTASCTVTVTTSLPPLLISDFENTDDISGIIYPNVNESNRKEHIHIDLIDDPKAGGKCVAISNGNYKDTEYSIINIPDAAKDYSILAFDIYYPGRKTDADGEHEDMNYKTIPVSLTYKDGQNQDQNVKIAEYHTPVFPAPVWDTKLINITGKIPADATSIKVKIGPINSVRAQLYLDNIRVKENPDDVEDFKQDEDLSDIWWKVENNTLYIRGNGVIPDYTGNKQCPWAAQTPNIEHVVVSEGITGIGDYSVGNSQKDNVDITLHSIPEYFGENCLKRQYNEGLTRTLHLVLRDAEKPFIAKSKSEFFPTFNTVKYYRNVTSNYSTVCLPFPVAKDIVTDAGVELFDFTSIEKNGEQYTLAFKKHSGGMAAGQTYLIKKHNIEGALENTDVEKDQFILTPKVSTNTITGSDPTFSISMIGVFQPSVFGPNLGTEDAPVYAYGFLDEKFYKNSGNMSVRPMRGYFYGSQLYSGQQQSGAKKMPKMFNFEIVRDIETHISSPDFIAEDFNIEEVYSPSGMKTNSLNKGLNIIRTSTGRVLKVMVK